VAADVGDLLGHGLDRRTESVQIGGVDEDVVEPPVPG